MPSQLLKRLEILESAQSVKVTQHIATDGNNVSVLTANPAKIYKPTPTGEQFHNDNSFVRLVMGPYGSGKSTMCCAEIVKRTCEMPAWNKGVRRSKWAIVRNTSGELQSTTLQTWLTWFGDLGDIRKRQKPILTYEHVFNDGKGLVEIELIFLALDREDDLRKVRSLEVTGCYINEASEVPQGALSHFKGRVNRYPSRAMCPEYYWSGIIADTNPPDTDHWIYKDFETKVIEDQKVFHQPAGLIKNSEGHWMRNADADNANNLPRDYYTKLAQGQTEEFVKVFCLGQYGSVIFGKRVYPEYNDDIHSTNDLKPIQGLPIHIGWDFGLTPAAVIVQFTARGQLLILKEYIGEDIGIMQFAESVVIPNIKKDFPGFTVENSKADPSGAASRDTDESTCIEILCDLGFKTDSALSNVPTRRIEAVKYFLTRMPDGTPAFSLSRTGCPKLRKGFLGDYHYRRLSVSGEEKFQEKPNKNGSSHPHDALQYIAMEFAAETMNMQSNKKVNDLYNPVFRYL